MSPGLSGDLKDIVRSLKAYIELERESGFEEFLSTGAVAAGASRTEVGSDAGWISLKKEVLACARCGLHKTRKNVVFGSGHAHARLMFIGEAPGEEEDKQGLPFVGRAGQLLTKIIEAMGMGRADVYIANVLKCRPPGNRMPLPTEILECEEHLKRQVELVKPKVICALGKFAAQTLLKTTEPISALRGKFRDYQGIPLMPTFHPAYLLRNPPDKRLVWEDMKKIAKKLKEVE